jgi:hypothetical protein
MAREKPKKQTATHETEIAAIARSLTMPKSVVVVDRRVTDYQLLIDSLTQPAEVLILHDESDGLAQIAAYLQGQTGIDAIHVISHGSQGAIYLGTTVLDSSTLAAHGSQLASIGNAMTNTGDILLYGCNVAQGDVGLQFIASLAQYTGADVAASNNTTGDLTLGGDWVLEQATGTTETLSIVSTSYQSLLLAESEPNGTRGTANAISLNTSVVGFLLAYTDIDYYSVAATAAGTLSVVFDVPTNSSSSDYFKLGLYDASGTLLSLFSTGVDKTYSVGIAAAGTYYISVTGNDYLDGYYYSSGQYSLTVSNVAGATNGSESEANDTRATSDTATLGTAITGQLSSYTDLDYYSVAATAAGTLSVVFDVPTNSSSSDYFKLGLYDASGTLLSLFSTGVDKTYSVGIAAAGTYYISVTGNDYLDGYYYSSGQYSLTVSNVAGATNGSESEGNDTRATSDTATLGTAITGQLSSTSDADWFRADITSPTVVSVSIDVPTNSGYSDYFSVSVFNSTGTLLVKQATGTDLVFNFRATEAGSYYTVLSSPSYYYDSGNYSLTLTQGANTGTAYESESNNTRATANTMAAGIPTHGQLSSSTDLDYYAINLTSAGKLHFAFDSPTNSSYSNYFTLSLVDSNGTALASQASGSDMILDKSVDSAGTYYAVVAAAPGYSFSAGEYALTASTELNIPIPVGAILGTNLGDNITGTAGDDLVFGNGGNDQINGAAGSDTAYFVTPQANLTISTIAGLTTVRGNYSAGAYSDTVSKLWNIETIQTASGAISLTPTPLTNSPIFGTKGAESISGTSGADLIDGFGGSDIIDGGAGSDTLALFASKSQFQIDTIAGITLIRGGTSAAEYANTATYVTNVESVVFEQNQTVTLQSVTGNAIYGTSSDDQIIGTSGDDIITGRSGNDVINGGAGTDTLVLFAPASTFSVKFVNGTDSKITITGVGNSAYGGKVITAENIEVIAFSDRTESITAPPGLVLTNPTLTLAEGGTTSQLTVALATVPGQSVTVKLTGDSQLTSSQAQLVFTAQNWNVPQSVTISAVDDAVYEKQQSGTLALAISSTDTLYGNLPTKQIVYTITDNDSPSFGTVAGQVWGDTNRDGTVGGSEGGLAGWTVFDDKNHNGKPDAGETSATTDASGHYALPELSLGAHTVSILQKSGWTATFPNASSSSASVISPTTVTGEVSLDGTIGLDVALSSVGFGTLGTTTNIDDFHKDPRFTGIDGKGYAVAVIDSGIDLGHPFFGTDANQDGIADRIVFQYDFYGANDSSAQDGMGHGTHVSGIIGSSDSNFPGIAPAVNLVELKVFHDKAGSASNGDIKEALNWVIANAAKYNIVAVNMSLGSGEFYSARTIGSYSQQLQALSALGVTVVSASGNDYAVRQKTGVSYPSADPYSLSVGAIWAGGGSATDQKTGQSQVGVADAIAFFSQRDPLVSDIFAPGIWIDSAKNGGGDVQMAGTSMASPEVAGMVVLAQQLADQELGRRLSFTEIKSLIHSTGTPIVDGDNENDTVVNTGATYYRIDMMALANAILDLKPLLSQQVTVSAGQTTDNIKFGFAGLDHVQGLSTGDMIVGTSAGENISGMAGDDVIDALGGDDIVAGDDGNDAITGGEGSNAIDGGHGFDVALYNGRRVSFALTKTVSGFTLTDNTGAAGTDTLQNIERIKFSDGGIALDVGATQSAGETALLLGAVLPGRLVFDTSKQALLGGVIDLFDQGYSLQTLSGAVMRLPIWDVLTGKATPSNADIATYLLTNVNGTAPDATTLANAVTSLNIETDFASQGNFLWHLAESSANQTHVGLVGLVSTGLEYAV